MVKFLGKIGKIPTSLEGILTASVLVPFRILCEGAPWGGPPPWVAWPCPTRRRRRAGEPPSSPLAPQPVRPHGRARLPAPGAPWARSVSPPRKSTEPRPAALLACRAPGCSSGGAAGGERFQRTARPWTAAQRPAGRPRSSCLVGMPGPPRRGWKECSKGRGARPCLPGEHAVPRGGSSQGTVQSLATPWGLWARLRSREGDGGHCQGENCPERTRLGSCWGGLLHPSNLFPKSRRLWQVVPTQPCSGKVRPTWCKRCVLWETSSHQAPWGHYYFFKLCPYSSSHSFPVDLVDSYIEWFLNVNLILYSWNRPHLALIYCLFYVFWGLIY